MPHSLCCHKCRVIPPVEDLLDLPPPQKKIQLRPSRKNKCLDIDLTRKIYRRMIYDNITCIFIKLNKYRNLSDSYKLQGNFLSRCSHKFLTQFKVFFIKYFIMVFIHLLRVFSAQRLMEVCTFYCMSKKFSPIFKQ